MAQVSCHNRRGIGKNGMVSQQKTVKIGSQLVGDGQPCYVVAEIGINHNGDLDMAKRLISVAVAAGCQAVKLQKRTVDVVYSPEELARPRESPFGTTNGELKWGLELAKDEFTAIDEYCRMYGVVWFASCWTKPPWTSLSNSTRPATRSRPLP